jgi:hypothetical protein
MVADESVSQNMAPPSLAAEFSMITQFVRVAEDDL